MAHPYKHVGKAHPHSTERVHKLFGHLHQKNGETATYATGGGVTPKTSKHHGKTYDGMKSKVAKEVPAGGKSMKRLDKYARGGKVKHGGKGHHTKINIVVAPKAEGPASAGPMPGGPPAPMPPKAPMAPPPSPMAGGMPGMGGPPMGAPKVPVPPMGGPGGMKRGGAVKSGPKYISGIANPENIAKWGKRTSENTRYASGGKVLTPETGGSLTGTARLAKAKKYGLKKGK